MSKSKKTRIDTYIEISFVDAGSNWGDEGTLTDTQRGILVGKSQAEKAQLAFAKFSAKVNDITKRVKTFNLALNKLGLNPFYKIAENFNTLGRILRQTITRVLLRNAVTSLFSGVQEGIQSAYLYSKAHDNIFAENMDNLYSKLKYLQLSFVSMFLPLINSIGSTSSNVFDSLADVFGTIAEFFAAVTGQKTFMKAKKIMWDYGDTISGANESAQKLKNTLAGFDDMNVLQDNTKTSSTKSVISEFSQLWEVADVTAEMWNKAEDWREKLKEIRVNLRGFWLTLKSTFFPAIASGFSYLGDFILMFPWEKIIDGISSLVSFFSDSKNSLRISKDAVMILGIWTAIRTRNIYPLYLATLYGIGLETQKIYDELFESEKMFINDRLGKKYGNISNTNTGKSGSSTSNYSGGSRGFATGGFPEEGPFYINRGEIAGKFSNGATVVANNQQITEGISKAVYSAVTKAKTKQIITFSVDGQTLATTR